MGKAGSFEKGFVVSTVFLLLFVLVVFAPTQAQAATYHVNQDGTEDFTDIQSALTAAGSGDIIIVRNGTYIGANNKNLDFGGKAITLQSESGPTACIIDCEGVGRGVYFHTGEGPSSVLDGFTIVNGVAPGTGYTSRGGGIRCDTSSPTIRNCVISNCSAESYGGGLYCYAPMGTTPATPTITNCTFSGNSAIDPSGTFNAYGGGLWIYNSSPTIINCIVSGNSASFMGGGFHVYYLAYPVITNCTITGNSATSGGGIGSVSYGGPIVKNSILWGNSATNGPEICVGGSPYGSDITVSYSDVQGGEAAVFLGDGCTSDPAGCNVTWGAGNIDADPMLDTNYHLLASSPCIDAGTDAGVYSDIDGDTRPLVAGYDMGADEFLGYADADGDGFTEDVDCDDNDSSVCPGAPELCDAKDNDCDGMIPADEVDTDGDGYMVCDGDCNDDPLDPFASSINPGAQELPGDLIDDNCDGSLGACDPNLSWKNHGQFVRCVAHETDALITAGHITQEEGDELISTAAQSDIGKNDL